MVAKNDAGQWRQQQAEALRPVFRRAEHVLYPGDEWTKEIYAGAQWVHLRAGVYYLYENLTIPQPIHLTGDGAGVVHIIMDTYVTITFEGAGSRLSHIMLSKPEEPDIKRGHNSMVVLASTARNSSVASCNLLGFWSDIRVYGRAGRVQDNYLRYDGIYFGGIVEYEQVKLYADDAVVIGNTFRYTNPTLVGTDVPFVRSFVAANDGCIVEANTGSDGAGGAAMFPPNAGTNVCVTNAVWHG